MRMLTQRLMTLGLDAKTANKLIDYEIIEPTYEVERLTRDDIKNLLELLKEVE